MTIHILKHKNSNFSGTLFGVGFFKGRGSTSSGFDKKRCEEIGCKDITQKFWADKAIKDKKEEVAAVKAEKTAAKKKADAEKKKEKAETPAPEKEKDETPAPEEKDTPAPEKEEKKEDAPATDKEK